MDWVRGEYRISDDPASLDLEAIEGLLRLTYWASDRPRDVIERSIRGSFCLGVYLGPAQVGFARAITDYATFAWLCDVVIHPDHRRQGLGKWLVQTLIEHPRLQVRSQYLTTEDAHTLYERFGFTPFGTLKRHPGQPATLPSALGDVPVLPAAAGGASPRTSCSEPLSRPSGTLSPLSQGEGGGLRFGGSTCETTFGEISPQTPNPTCPREQARIRDGLEAIESVRALFREYAGNLGFSLCFQGFDEEIATLPGRYAPPGGRLLLLEADGMPVGCAGLRPVERNIGEMKRLFVRPSHRGRGLGRLLAVAVIEEARRAGYERLVLDTLNTMVEARALYASLGFREIPAWMPHPVCGSIAMEKRLD